MLIGRGYGAEDDAVLTTHPGFDSDVKLLIGKPVHCTLAAL
jgi:hypothetical protein